MTIEGPNVEKTRETVADMEGRRVAVDRVKELEARVEVLEAALREIRKIASV